MNTDQKKTEDKERMVALLLSLSVKIRGIRGETLLASVALKETAA
jgi:hypothetical protein